VSLVLISLQTAIGQLSDSCVNDLSSEFDTSLSNLGEVILKERQSFAEVLENTTKYDFFKNYTLMSEAFPYISLTEKCAGLNLTMCEVSTSVAFTRETGDTFFSLEDSFPVCFPPQCNDNHTSQVRYTPSFCEENEKCSVTETLQCDDDREVDPLASDATCEEAVKPLKRAAFRRPSENLVRILDQTCLLNMEGDIGRQTDRRNRCRIMTKSGDELSRFSLHKDFSAFSDPNGDIQALKETCESLGHKICYMDSEIIIGEKLIHETKKTICFPSSCTEDAFIATQVTSCTDCDVKRSILCPNDDMTGGGFCSSDVEAAYELESELNIRDKDIVDSVNDLCIKALHGDSSAPCSFETKTTSTQILAVGNKTTEDNFIETCYVLGGNYCLVDAHMLVDKQEKGENSETNVSFASYPVCKPANCSESVDFVAVALNMAASTLTLSSITCFDSPTALPSIPFSLSPSYQYTTTPTTKPSAITDLPTVSPSVATDSPTVSPSAITGPTASPSTKLLKSPKPAASIAKGDEARTSGAILIRIRKFHLFLFLLYGVWFAI